MDWLILIFGGGFAIFIGAGLILCGSLILTFISLQPLRQCVRVMVLTGVILVALSAAPFHPLAYVCAAILMIFWAFVETFDSRTTALQKKRLRLLIAVFWLIGMLLETSAQILPKFEAPPDRTIYVLGDSVTAGTSGQREEGTWPHLLARWYGIVIEDFSGVGATAASAFKQAENLPKTGGIVILEIGGNDLLGTTSDSQYELDLDRLLERVCGPDRVVLMFELPLPPLRNEFGRIQRRLADNYGVLLIPKRVFARVLASEAGTLDGVHLSRDGHVRMADAVWDVLAPGYGEGFRL